MARQGICLVLGLAEPGVSMMDLARKFDITPAAVSYAIQRGEKIAKEWDYELEA